MGIKHKPFSICDKLNILNRLNGIPIVPRCKIAEELGIPVRKVTDRRIGQSDVVEKV